MEVTGLSSGFDQKLLFRNISFSLQNPSFLAILGLNGSGKSTFLRTFINKQPFQGEIFLEGQNVNSLSQKQLSYLVSFLQQQNYINFSIPVRELVVMGKFNSKSLFQSYNEQDYLEVEEKLRELKIDHLALKNITELSGGEQQLVWICQLLMQKTKIWLLDEPTQNLDLYRKNQVFHLFKKLVAERQKTIVCITHDISNLYGMEGYLLNLSSPSPELQVLNKESLDKNIKILEKGFSRI